MAESKEGFFYPELRVDRPDKITDEMKESLIATYWDPENPYILPEEDTITVVSLRYDEEHGGFHVRIVESSRKRSETPHPVGADAGYITNSADGHFATAPMQGIW